MLAVYVVLYNGTTLWHTIGLIEIVMTCYGGKSKFADVLWRYEFSVLFFNSFSFFSIVAPKHACISKL